MLRFGDYDRSLPALAGKVTEEQIAIPATGSVFLICVTPALQRPTTINGESIQKFWGGKRNQEKNPGTNLVQPTLNTYC
jgi:hypothetical protein